MPGGREILCDKTKEAAGKTTGDRRLQAEGKTQPEGAEGKPKAKTAVDGAKGALDGVKAAFEKRPR